MVRHLVCFIWTEAAVPCAAQLRGKDEVMAMIRFVPSTLYSIAAATLMSAVVVPASMDVAATGLGSVTPEFVAASGSPIPTPVSVQSGSSQTSPAAPHAKRASVDRVEARIAELHKELKITDAQGDLWNGFAQVMRDNSQTMQALADQRSLNQKTMSAVDDLASYETITEAHVEGLKKLVPAFQALYDAMSPEQKKTADAVFSRYSRRVASNTAMSSGGAPRAKP